MEERVKVCRGCNAIVGWFSLFCEACGQKQDDPAPPGAAAREAPPPAPSPLEAEVRTQLVAPLTDARGVARDLFQTQLRLIHRHRQGVEDLVRDVEAIKTDLASSERSGGGTPGRVAIDQLSARMFDAEQRWGELQVAYNRDSEIIEEESRESMETADLDAYLGPDEREKVEGEYAMLSGRFEAVDALLRDTGRAIALGRQAAGSRYVGGAGGGGAFRIVLLLITAGLVGWSLYSALFLHKEELFHVATTLGPLVLALMLWVVVGFSRRASG